MQQQQAHLASDSHPSIFYFPLLTLPVNLHLCGTERLARWVVIARLWAHDRGRGGFTEWGGVHFGELLVAGQQRAAGVGDQP